MGGQASVTANKVPPPVQMNVNKPGINSNSRTKPPTAGGHDSVRSNSRQSDPNKSFFANHSDEFEFFLMPIYYTTQPLTPHEKGKAMSAFREISQNRSTEFTRLKQEYPFLVCKTPTEFFGNQFFRRLLEVHPTCGPLFKNSTMKQGSLLVRMFAKVLEEWENEEILNEMIRKLANVHNDLGIKAMEYGIFGEVLFYSLRLCLGLKAYDSVTHAGWTKIYSRMLSIIIPEVVRYELHHKEDFLASKNTRLMTEVPRYSGAIILSGDANAPISSVAARGKKLHILSVDNPNLPKKEVVNTDTANAHAGTDLKPGIDETDHLSAARQAHEDKLLLQQQQQQLLLQEQARQEESIQREATLRASSTPRNANVSTHTAVTTATIETKDNP